MPSIGTDIVDVKRIAKSIRNPRFLSRIFTSAEIRYCKDKKSCAQHFAVRFAAKEAVWKALSDFKVKGIAHKEIGVARSADGKPSVKLSGRLKRFEKKISLSLSHTHEYALAVAVLW
jgi:holo-[acyl-carrier protein] synthase